MKFKNIKLSFTQKIVVYFEGLSIDFLIILFGILINRLGGFIIPFLTLYLTQSEKFSLLTAGKLAALTGFGSLFAGFFGGYLSDRFNRKIVVITALFLGVFSLAVISINQDESILKVAFFCLGLFGNMHRPGVSDAISEIVSAESLSKAFGLVYWAGNLGFSVAMILGGLLASINFKLLLYLDALTTIIYILCIYWSLPKHKKESKNKENIQILSVFHDGNFLIFSIIFFMTTLIMAQATNMLPIDMKQKGLNTTQIGLALALNGIIIFLFQPLMSKKTEAKKPSRILAYSVLFLSFGIGMQALSYSFMSFLMPIAIWSVGEMMGAALFYSVVSSYAPVNIRASYLGYFQMAEGLGLAIAPAIGAAVIANYNSTILWFGCWVLGIILAFCLLIFSKKLSGENKRL